MQSARRDDCGAQGFSRSSSYEPAVRPSDEFDALFLGCTDRGLSRAVHQARADPAQSAGHRACLALAGAARAALRLRPEPDPPALAGDLSRTTLSRALTCGAAGF